MDPARRLLEEDHAILVKKVAAQHGLTTTPATRRQPREGAPYPYRIEIGCKTPREFQSHGDLGLALNIPGLNIDQLQLRAKGLFDVIHVIADAIFGELLDLTGLGAPRCGVPSPGIHGFGGNWLG